MATKKRRKKPPKRDLGHGFVLPAPLPDLEGVDEELAAHVAVLDAARPKPAETKAARDRLREHRPTDGEALLPFVTDALLDAGANPYSDQVRDALPKDEQRAYDRASSKASTAWTKRKTLLELLFRALALHDVAEERLVEVATGDGDDRARLIAAQKLLDSERPVSAPALERLATLADSPDPQLVRYGAVATFRVDPEGAFDRLRPQLWHDTWTITAAVMQGIPKGFGDPRIRARVAELAGSLDTGLRTVALFAIKRSLELAPDLVEPLLRAMSVCAARGRVLPEPLLTCLAEVRDPRALPALVRALDPEMMGRKDVALKGVEALGDPAALPAVERYLLESPKDARALALRDVLAAKEPDPSRVAEVEAAAAALGTDVAPPAPLAAPPPPPREPATMPPPAEQREALLGELGPELAEVAGLMRGAIGLVPIRLADDEEPATGASRFGGDPDLPAGFEWPAHGDRPLSFVAQLNLAELHPFDADGRLPAAGWLLFFVEPEFDDAVDYLSVSHVAHVPADAALSRVKAKGERTPCCAVHPYARVQLPGGSHPAVQAFAAAYEDAVGDNGADGEHQLLGYRSNEWDTPKGAELLLQLASDEHPAWTWGDEAHVAWYLPPDKLAAGDLSAAFSQYAE